MDQWVVTDNSPCTCDRVLRTAGRRHRPLRKALTSSEAATPRYLNGVATGLSERH